MLYMDTNKNKYTCHILDRKYTDKKYSKKYLKTIHNWIANNTNTCEYMFQKL